MTVPETVRAFCRRRSLELMNSVVPISMVADVLGVTTASVSRWRALNHPVSKSAGTSRGGRPRKLTDKQLAELAQLLSKGATAHGWPNDIWTTKRMAELIRSRFNITCRPNQAWTIVTKYLGWT